MSKTWQPITLVPGNPPSKDPMDLPHPFRAWVMGPSGGGKTNFVINLLQYLKPFDKLFYFGNNLTNPTIERFQEICQDVEKENPDVSCVFSDDLAEFPTVNEMKQTPDEHKVVIFDDFSDLNDKEVKQVSTYGSQGRGANCSVFFISHYYTGSKDSLRKIRNNCNWFVLFPGLPQDTIKLIARQYLDTIDPEIFYRFYVASTDRPGRFIIVDRVTPYQNLKIRTTPDKCFGTRLYEDSKRLRER